MQHQAFLDSSFRATTSVAARLARAMMNQRVRTPVCPASPRLDGAVALVTGSNAGIGRAIAEGLAARGASLIIAARKLSLAREVAASAASLHGVMAHAIALDLSDLRSVASFTAELTDVLGGNALTHFVQNAGVWPKAFALSAQGHEIAFATNVLGHFALTQSLFHKGLLGAAARVVVQTGDIYIMARDCTPDFSYRGAWGGTLAYCRSKLGNIWFARELQRRYPTLEVAIAHPGVVASGLVKTGNRYLESLRDKLLLDPVAGAQTALILATQPGVKGAVYFHNTSGQMLLSPSDPALDDTRAVALWETLERLATAR